MTNPRKSKQKTRPVVIPDAMALLSKLRTRLEKARVALDRWRKRHFRACHAYERQHRLVARLQRRIAKLEGG